MTRRMTITDSPGIVRLSLEILLALALVWFAAQVESYTAGACESQLPAVDVDANSGQHQSITEERSCP